MLYLYMGYSRLFEPLNVGRRVTLPNRLVMAPMTTTAGEENGEFSSQEIAYLKRRATHGIGTIITPACYCHKSGHAFERQVGCHTDAMLPSLARCAGAINRQGAASFLQIHHGGNAAREAYIGHPPLAPSAVRNRRGTSEMPRAMTETDIEMIIEAFAAAAGRAKQAGFTGIELHGANTYLLQQFFSPFTNRRTDRWGEPSDESSEQHLVNRARFACEVVRAVRAEVGTEYPVVYRISPEEEEPDGYSVYDSIELLKLLIPIGIDIVHVSSWEYGMGIRGDCPADSHPTREIRKALPLEIPVIGVGGIKHPDQVLRVLEDGIELAALGQILLLNHDWAELVRDGKTDEIRARVDSEPELAGLDLPERMKTYCRRFLLDS